MKKLLLGAALVVVATSMATAQGYYYATPYGYGLYGTGNFPGLYAHGDEPNAAPAATYDGGVYGTARNWQYYRSQGPGRANNEESTR
jgi:opacity protein-like surface antigen